ncbi:Heme/hemopexin utilization protein C [Rhodocyclaceae bacterium]|nr:Heme/hemopexin utilization protein C [Rhodocyclaceae bacterium]
MPARCTTLRRRLCVAALAAALACSAHAGEVAIDLPAQELGPALGQVAHQAGIQILFSAELVKGRRAPALKGSYAPEAALHALLAGSGLATKARGASTFALVAATSPGQGAMEPTLSEVSVVAMKTRRPLAKTPAAVSVADQERLDEVQATSIQPVIRAMPNVEMGGGPRLDALIPTIRGAQGASVTLLLDGARQNDLQAVGMKAPLYADPYFLKQVEVLRGASSSLYGSGGNGGVMSLTTISARDLLDDGKGAGGGVKAGHASADNSTHLNARIYGANESADALVAVGKHDWNKVRLADGSYLDPNDGGSTTGLVKVGLNPDRESRIEFSHQFYDSNNLSPNNPQVKRYKLTTDPFNVAIPFLQPTSVNQYNTVLKAEHGSIDALDKPRIEGSFYQSHLTVALDPYGTNPAYKNAANQTYNLTKTKTDGATGQLTLSLGNHRLAVGGDLFSDRLDAKSGTATSAVNAPGNRRGMGVFAQDEITLGSGWKAIPTLRYDHYKATTGIAKENSASRFSPKATLAWESSAGLMAYASYGEGFRAPAVIELYQNSQIGIFSWFHPNTDLRPEIDKTYELGSKANWQGVLADGDALKLRAAVFRSDIKDLISNVVIGQISANCPVTGTGCKYQYQNIPHARRTGAEMEATYKQGLWQYDLGFGRVRVSNTDTSEGLFSPPDKLSLQVRRKLPDHGLSALWSSTIVGAQDYDATVLRRRAGYAVHDLFLSWTPAGQKVRIDAGISNLFDKAYVIYQSSNTYANAYQEGRSLKVSVGTDF